MAEPTKMRSAQSSSITEMISNYNIEEFRYSDLYFKIINDIADNNFIFNDKCILDDYRAELKTLLVSVELTASEYADYKYNPKRLSHDLYGTTELWFLLLDANEIYSATQFDMDVIYVYNSRIYSIISEIITNEKISIDYNLESLGL